ncbi:MAG: response regulator transcription factor [Bacillota bacterium]
MGVGTTEHKANSRIVLVVDDEPDLVKLLKFNLEKEGYSVHTAASGSEAIAAALHSPPDLIILDVMLPEMDGLDVCRRLRSIEQTAAVPILMLSARREELDRVLGLEMGADDYVVKPFSVRELVARVRAMLRRQDRKAVTGVEEVLVVNDVTLYPERHQVVVRGEACLLTFKEFSLLYLLMANAGKVMTRDLLLERVWGYETDIDTRTVDVHIRYLRQKIEADPAAPVYIETVRGVGYRFAR